jgi:hypothetical protein
MVDRYLAGLDNEKLARYPAQSGARLVAFDHAIVKQCSVCSSPSASGSATAPRNASGQARSLSHLQRVYLALPPHQQHIVLDMRFGVDRPQDVGMAEHILFAHTPHQLPANAFLCLRLPHAYPRPTSWRPPSAATAHFFADADAVKASPLLTVPEMRSLKLAGGFLRMATLSEQRGASSVAASVPIVTSPAR